jgi:hypothetical protein
VFAHAQTVTIAQVRDFLISQQKAKSSDTYSADRLGTVSLSERLDDETLRRLIRDTQAGPETIQQLRLLADYSIFIAPPPPDNLGSVPPTPDQQRRILDAGADYVQRALQRLPDFLATRTTQRFDNAPQPPTTKRGKPKIQLHWVGQLKDQITYRNGGEISDSSASSGTAEPSRLGLTSMGEFGPILSTVFGDFPQGSVVWSRWEVDAQNDRLAVFHFSVPKSASHYLIDFCCYSGDDQFTEQSFRDKPAYHGEMVVDPNAGTVRRISIEADLDSTVPITASAIAVEYGNVEIGERSYVCPLNSIAILSVRSRIIEHIDGVGIQRQLNETQYADYHKFGSTSRIVATER